MRLSLVAALLPASVAATGCSFLYELDAQQCESDSDCRALGPEFTDMVCRASQCVTESGSTGGSPSTGGQGGAPDVECTSNGECIDDNFGTPHICRQGSCLPLTIPQECPIVVGGGQNLENLRKPDPIIFGAYSFVDPAAPRLSVPTLNYELAIDEVNTQTRGGLMGGSGGSLRPFVAIICSATNDPDFDKSLAHLIDDVQVPAIISSMFTTDLLESFTTEGAPNDVFFLSPLEADSTLTQVDDDGLMWHMLAPALDLAPAYAPLLTETEKYVRAKKSLEPTDAVKVALVESKTPFLTDMANWIEENVEFNGKTPLQNKDDDNYLRIRIDSSLEVANPEIASALDKLDAFEPDIVIGASSGESVQLFANYDASLPLPSDQKPFYLVSPYVFARSDLASRPFVSRLLGVNFAASEDTTLYDSYLSRLESTYDVGFSLEGAENFYDVAYFLMYSIAAAGEPPVLTGREIAKGMTRLLPGKTTFDVGPTDVNDIVGNLRGSADSTISLHGTMGPPDFNTATGARDGLPSIYCIDSSDRYVQNAMTYDPDAETLQATPSCIPDFPDG